MRKLKNFISVLICFLSITALVSCSDSINKKVPYGNISDDVYASIKGAQITNKELYDLLRKKGLSIVTEDIKNKLFSDVIALADYTDPKDKEKIDSIIISEIYNVTTTDAYKKLDEKTISSYIEKFLDTKFNAGVTLNKEDIVISVDTVDGEEVFITNFPDSLVKEKLYSIGLTKYAENKIREVYKNQYDEKGLKNKFYISEDDIQEYYHNNGKYYRTTQAITIKFSSVAQAERVMNKVLGSTTIDTSRDSSEVLKDYIDLYNEQYIYRKKLVLAEPDNTSEEHYLDSSYVNFIVNKDKNELNSVSTNFESIVNEMEDGKSFDTYKNIDGSYYLVYRISSPKIIEWDELKTTDKYDEIREETIGYLIDKLNTVAYQNELINEVWEKIYEENLLEIYDPVVAALYKSSNNDYKFSNKFNNNLVYSLKYNDKEYSLTVDEFYNKLENIYGMSVAVTNLIDKFALNTSFVNDVNDETIKAYTDSLDKDIKNFKKGKASYSKNIGLEAYLNITYGYSTKAEVLRNYYLASNAKTLMLSYYGTHTIDSENFNQSDKLFTNFMEICKEIYEKEFTTEISHILIYIDDDGSGDMVNPDLYYQNLPSQEVKDAYNQALLKLSQTIVSETKILTKSMTVSQALNYIVTAYESDKKVVSTTDENDTWNDYKTFNFVLKFEDLGTITYSSSANYVESFSKAVIGLYNKFKEDSTVLGDDDEGFLQFTDEEALTSVEQLCKTNYGYHILNIYSVTTPKSALFTKDSDYFSDSNSEYKAYEHLQITIEKDGDDDDEIPDRYLYANAYSDNAYPSTSQLFIYFYEYLNGGVTSLTSTRKTAIANLFDQVISRYTSTNFKEYRSLLLLEDLKFTNDISGQKYDRFVQILERTINNYTTNEDYMFENWFTYDWTIELPN